MKNKNGVAKTSTCTEKPDSTEFLHQIFYALPCLATSFVIGSLPIVQGLYAKYFGIGLTTIASILFISRLFDAVTDPIIGWWSDRYHSRNGSRKPFVFAGGLLFLVSSYFLYTPVGVEVINEVNGSSIEASEPVSPVYFLVWILAFYFSWTLFEIPHLSWGSEISSGPQEKNVIYSLRAGVVWLGVLLFHVTPLLPIFETQEFTPKTLNLSILGVAFLMIPLLCLCVIRVPSVTPQQVTPTKFSDEADSFGEISAEIFMNKPLVLFLMAYLLFNLSSGMWISLLFIYTDSYLGLGESFAQVSLIGLSIGIPMIAGWFWMAIYFSKKSILGFALCLSAIGTLGTGFLTPGGDSLVPLCLVIILCFGMGGPAMNSLGPPMLSDIIDYGRWKSGKNRSATYFSLYTTLTKIGAAIGGTIGFSIAGYYNFEPTEISHSLQAIQGMQLAISWLPSALILLSIILFLLHPISVERHRIIQRRLDSTCSRTVMDDV